MTKIIKRKYNYEINDSVCFVFEGNPKIAKVDQQSGI